MPNGHGERAKDERKQIDRTEQEGWEHLTTPPDWLRKYEKSDLARQAGFGHYEIAHGDTYVYRIESTVHDVGCHYYRQLKSDYFDTTRNEGTCPNCQSYVSRNEDDRFLTCHRCGWTVGYPILRWLRYPSWVDYYW